MPGLTGMDVVRELQATLPEPERPGVLMMTAHGTVRNAVEAMKLGVRDYLQKPFDIDELLVSVRRAVEEQQARSGLRYLLSEQKPSAITASSGTAVALQDYRTVSCSPVAEPCPDHRETEPQGLFPALHDRSAERAHHWSRHSRPFRKVCRPNCSCMCACVPAHQCRWSSPWPRRSIFSTRRPIAQLHSKLLPCCGR